MYLVIVVYGSNIFYFFTVWDFINKKVTVGFYGFKYIYLFFKIVVIIFGYDCVLKILLVSEVIR